MLSDPLSSQSSCASITSKIAASDRSLDWVRVWSKKSEDGSYYIPNEKTMGVFGKIIEKCEEMSQGSFQPARQNDILSAALGTNEHGGYVRGVGVHSKNRDVFGMPSRGKSSWGVSGVDLEAMEKNLYEKLADKIRRETREEMEEKFKDMQSQLQSFMKNAQASPRVGTPFWSSCQSVDPVNEFKLQPTIVSEDVLEHLGDESKKMVSYLRHLPANLDNVEMEIEDVGEIFHHSNMAGVVMFDDIKDLLTMQWLDVSIIQVFIVCLYRLCKKIGVPSIGFVCPRKISKASIKTNYNAVVSYLLHAIEKEKDRTFISTPYHQESRWLLLVIWMKSKVVYVLDPLPCNRDLEIKAPLSVAFRSTTNLKGQRAKHLLKW
ncbi:uncharacterized protein LOC115999420 [Ipomoea triloba]|uniref:uncharacterized protein LOC115999420 n=1 Tax=Ipomoea triloba TaxID=35885 RepID=UPI00125E42C6|nr:uncharacterized protein LOC115999420 [Ipomoea triloba]